MHILSHRGLGFSLPENTLDAFKVSLEHGFGIEFDVRLTKDKEAIVIHNDFLEFNNSNILVSDISLKEVRSIIPTLSEVLELISQYKILSALHLKQYGDVLGLLVGETIKRHNLTRSILVLDPTIELAKLMKSSFPDMLLAFSVAEDHFGESIYLLDEIIELPECDVIWWDEWGKSGAVYNDAQMKKIAMHNKLVYAVSPELHVDTVPAHENSSSPENIWQILLDIGVDGVCTDLPKEFSEFYARHRS